MTRCALWLYLLCSLPAAAEDTPPAADPPACEVTRRDAALGSVSAMNAYTTAGYLGSLADLHAHKVLDKSQVLVRVGGHLAGLKASAAELDALLDSGALPSEEAGSLREMREVMELQLTQAGALRAYVASEAADDAKAFREARKTSWERLSSLLGLDTSATELLEPGGADLGLPKGH